MVLGFKFFENSVYHSRTKTLVFGDLHLGYEEALNESGILIPRQNFKNIMNKIKFIFEKFDVKTLVINGDIKHEFGTILDTEWRSTVKLLNFAKENTKNLILIKGNHDKILEPIANKLNLKLKEKYHFGTNLVCHGDQVPKIPSSIKTILIGHEHPCISFNRQGRKENYRAYLVGKFKKYNLIVLPSFHEFSQGTDIRLISPLSPFLQKSLSNFEVFLIEDKIYDFGKLKNLPK